MIDPRHYGLIELGLVFGAILGWAVWQWWGWWRWKHRKQAEADTGAEREPDASPASQEDEGR